MNWLKRTWLSIIRRPGKSILLFLSVFVMSNLLAGSLGIITTSETVKDEIKRGLGAEGNIILSTSNRMDEMNINPLQLNEILEQLCSDEQMDYGEYHYQIDALGVYGKKRLPFVLYSTNIAESADFRSGSKKLTRSKIVRNFTDEELANGEAVAVVDYELGLDITEEEILQTGFTTPDNIITLCIPIHYINENGQQEILEYPFDVKVIGSYQRKGNTRGESPKIYVPTQVFMKAIQEAKEFALQQQIDGDVQLMFDYAGFKLKDAYSLEEFDEKAKALLAQVSSDFQYTSSSDSYERSAGPVENLDTIAQIIFMAAVIATVMILSLVVLFFILERKKEMGIYVSLGEKAHHIVLQVLCEVILVSTLAVSVSSVTGMFLGNQLSSYMLEVQRYTKRQQDLGALANLPVLYKPIQDGLTNFTRDDVINTYKTRPTAEYFITLYASAEISILVACILPLVYLTHVKPKDILI